LLIGVLIAKFTGCVTSVIKISLTPLFRRGD